MLKGVRTRGIVKFWGMCPVRTRTGTSIVVNDPSSSSSQPQQQQQSRQLQRKGLCCCCCCGTIKVIYILSIALSLCFIFGTSLISYKNYVDNNTSTNNPNDDIYEHEAKKLPHGKRHRQYGRSKMMIGDDNHPRIKDDLSFEEKLRQQQQQQKKTEKIYNPLLLQQQQQRTALDPIDELMIPNLGWDVSPIVIEEYKLIFFTIPKTGTTIFKQLFRRMMKYMDWPNDKDMNLIHNPSQNGLRYLYHYSRKDVEEMFNSTEWTRAIFVREPKERLLSAYLDKALGNHGKYVKSHCCKINPNGGKVLTSQQEDDQIEKYQRAMKKRIEEQNQKREQQHQRQKQRKKDSRRRRLLQEQQQQEEGNIAYAYSSSRNIHSNDMKTTNYNTTGESSSSSSVSSLHSKALQHSLKATGGGISSGNDVPWSMLHPNLQGVCTNLSQDDDDDDDNDEYRISFDEFVYTMVPYCNDPHWKLQSKRVHAQIWDKINFIGYFHRLQNDTKKLLKQLNVWDAYGSNGWPMSRSSGTTTTTGSRSSGSIFETNTVRHQTLAKNQLNDYYTTPEIESYVVHQLYKEDYNHPKIKF